MVCQHILSSIESVRSTDCPSMSQPNRLPWPHQFFVPCQLLHEDGLQFFNLFDLDHACIYKVGKGGSKKEYHSNHLADHLIVQSA